MTTTITIKLKIEGGTADASYVIDEILDSGLLQDAINDHEYDAGELRVLSVMIDSVEKTTIRYDR